MTVRSARGLSRREIAERMGVQYPFVANLESGERRIPERHFPVLALELALPTETLRALAETAEADRRSSGRTDLLRPAITETAQGLLPSFSETGRAEMLAFLDSLQALYPTTASDSPDLDRLMAIAGDLKPSSLKKLLAYAQGLRDSSDT